MEHNLEGGQFSARDMQPPVRFHPPNCMSAMLLCLLPLLKLPRTLASTDQERSFPQANFSPPDRYGPGFVYSPIVVTIPAHHRCNSMPPTGFLKYEVDEQDPRSPPVPTNTDQPTSFCSQRRLNQGSPEISSPVVDEEDCTVLRIKTRQLLIPWTLFYYPSIQGSNVLRLGEVYCSAHTSSDHWVTVENVWVFSP